MRNRAIAILAAITVLAGIGAATAQPASAANLLGKKYSDTVNGPHFGSRGDL